MLKGMKFTAIEITVIKEGDAFIGYLPAFDLCSQGDTFEEAVKNVKEAAALLVEECHEHGTLDRLLRSLGWTRKSSGRKELSPPTVVGHVSEPICIPA